MVFLLIRSGAITFGRANSKYAIEGEKIEWFPVISMCNKKIKLSPYYPFDRKLKSDFVHALTYIFYFIFLKRLLGNKSIRDIASRQKFRNMFK